MRKNLLYFCTLLLFLSSPSHAKILVQVQKIDISDLYEKWVSFITLDHAITNEETQWGMMNRKSLPDNHGMIFTFNDSAIRKFWMFNCYIDLSIAYLLSK